AVAEPVVPDLNAVHRYQELYELAPIGLYTLDRRGCIREVNEKGAKLLGFPSTWLVGKSFIVFIARQDVERFFELLMDSVQNPGPRVIEVDLWVSNRTQPVEISMTTSGEGPSVHHEISVADLTESRETERRLQESLANWYSLVHNAPDTIMTVDS